MNRPPDDDDLCVYCGHARSKYSATDGPCEECAAMPVGTTAHQKAWHSFEDSRAMQRLLRAVFARPRPVTVELSADAQAILIVALGEWRETQAEAVATYRQLDGDTLAATPGSDTYKAAMALAAADHLIDTLEAARSVSVTLVLPAEDEDETKEA